MKLTWMSDAIATMLLAAIILILVLPRLARRTKMVPTGGYNALEFLVVLVRDIIARPALHGVSANAQDSSQMPLMQTRSSGQSWSLRQEPA